MSLTARTGSSFLPARLSHPEGRSRKYESVMFCPPDEIPIHRHQGDWGTDHLQFGVWIPAVQVAFCQRPRGSRLGSLCHQLIIVSHWRYIRGLSQLSSGSQVCSGVGFGHANTHGRPMQMRRHWKKLDSEDAMTPERLERRGQRQRTRLNVLV